MFCNLNQNRVKPFSSLLVLVAVTLSLMGYGQKKLKVLFLGNSYTYFNNLPQLVHDIALANNDSLLFDSNCPGGHTLFDHFNNNTSISKINSNTWDYVVIQAQSQEPSFSPAQVTAQTLPYAVKLDSIVAHNYSCTITTFFETWGRKNGDASNCATYPPVCTYLGMQNRLRQSYKIFADTCKGVMAPVGEAWRKSIAITPSLELYQSDESHPSLEGSYLAACVFYETLFQKSVLSNTYNPGIATQTLTFLQQTAHTVVNDSVLVWNIGKYNPCLPAGNLVHNSNIETTWQVFPNPSTGILTILSGVDLKKEHISYTITDLTGRVQKAGSLTSSNIDLTGLPANIYVLQLEGSNIHVVLRIEKN